MLTAESFLDNPTLRHAFFTRQGGVSEGRYSSMNCGLGSNDAPDRVKENRARAMAQIGLPPQALVTACQVHSARAVIVTNAWAGSERPEVDGLATRTPGLALGILTADCAPVLLADAEAGVIGAAHAGWRGAKGGILEATVSMMEALGARRTAITAALGPCIRRESYEVASDFRDAFIGDEPGSAALFSPGRRVDRFQFDLAGYVGRRLDTIGIDKLAVLPNDTYADAELFFSYRRVVLRGGGDYGRQLSTIALLP
jgi:YfiH family protein